MQEGCCCRGREVLAERLQQRSAMMGVHRKRGHELACVFSDLREWVNGWLLIRSSALTAFATSNATGLVFVESAVAVCTDPLSSPTQTHQTQHRSESSPQRMQCAGGDGRSAGTHLTRVLGMRHGRSCTALLRRLQRAAEGERSEQQRARTGQGACCSCVCSSCAVCCLPSACDSREVYGGEQRQQPTLLQFRREVL